MSDPQYREAMSEQAEAVRPQSSVEGALMELDKGLAGLGQSITHLENRLSGVTNDHPRATAEDVPRDQRKEPGGDSVLLVQLRGLRVKLESQTDRIEALIGRFDI